MGWRDIESEVVTLLIKGTVFSIILAVTITAVLFGLRLWIDSQ